MSFLFSDPSGRTRKIENENEGNGLRKGDRAFGGLGVLAVKERGVADGADAEAATLVGDLVAEGGALVSVETEKAEFHEFVGAEKFLELGEERRGKAAFAEF